MKHISFFICCSLLWCTATIAQDKCSKFYPMEEGASFELTTYDKNDKVQGIINYKVNRVEGNTAYYTVDMTDKKGKSLMNSEYGINCDEDGISIDFQSMMNSGMMGRYGDMDVSISGTNIYLPNNLSPGQELPEAIMEIDVTGAPIAITMSIKMVNRKIEGKETVTTPAGTFDCFVLTYDTIIDSGIKMTGRTKQWLTENVGMVKTEDYSDKSKLRGKSVLTAFQL